MGQQERNQYFRKNNERIGFIEQELEILKRRNSQAVEIIENIDEIKGLAKKGLSNISSGKFFYKKFEDYQKEEKKRRSLLNEDSAYKILKEKISLFFDLIQPSPDYSISEREYIREKFNEKVKEKNDLYSPKHESGYWYLEGLQEKIEKRELKEKEYNQIFNGTHPWLVPLLELEKEVILIRAPQRPTKKASSLKEWFNLFPYFTKKSN